MSAAPIEHAIHDALVQTFEHSVLEVINESGNHNVAPGSETHFKVIVVSEGFAGQGLVKRHRAVNACLKAQFEAGVHALSIQALTPAQWAERGGQVPDSPPCLGGSKK